MKRIFFIVGFNNWGKTYLFRNLFKKDKICDIKKIRSFRTDQTYKIFDFKFDIRFKVMQVSNDDIDLEKYLDKLEKLVLGKNCENIIVALCPTTTGENIEKYKGTHGHNESLDILRSSFIKRYEKHLIFLEKKWDKRAKLEISYIEKEYKKKKVRFKSKIIKSVDREHRSKEVIKYLINIYK